MMVSQVRNSCNLLIDFVKNYDKEEDAAEDAAAADIKYYS
jgi:hypothetical protein